MVEILKEYVSKRVDLLKIQFTEKSSLSAGFVSFLCILLIAFSFFIILLNFGIAFLIGESLGTISDCFWLLLSNSTYSNCSKEKNSQRHCQYGNRIFKTLISCLQIILI